MSEKIKHDFSESGQWLTDLFHERFGNGFWTRLRRKFWYTKAESIFLFTPLGGFTKERPEWEVRVME